MTTATDLRVGTALIEQNKLLTEQNKILANIAESLRTLANPLIVETSTDVQSAPSLGMLDRIKKSSSVQIRPDENRGVPSAKRAWHPTVRRYIAGALNWLNGQRMEMSETKAREGYYEYVRIAFLRDGIALTHEEILSATIDITGNSFESHYHNWIEGLKRK